MIYTHRQFYAAYLKKGAKQYVSNTNFSLGLQCCSVNKRRHRDQSRSLSLARRDRVPYGSTSFNCGGLLQLFDVFPSLVGQRKRGMVR